MYLFYSKYSNSRNNLTTNSKQIIMQSEGLKEMLPYIRNNKIHYKFLAHEDGINLEFVYQVLLFVNASKSTHKQIIMQSEGLKEMLPYT